MSWLSTRLKALQQLGLQAIFNYAFHTVSVRSGYLRWRTPAGSTVSVLPEQVMLAEDLFSSPERCSLLSCSGESGSADLLKTADEVCGGQVRLFGGEPVALELVPPYPLEHWTVYEHGLPAAALQAADAGPDAAREADDIKFTWEMGRFGWAIGLARAYAQLSNESYAQAFWQLTEQFLKANPPNLGPHWASGQEVALRLIALVFCSRVFAFSSHTTPARRRLLGEALAAHAGRIPPTLAYARAQNNNHLISEAAGLYTAAMALPHHPQAARWQELGWRWLNYALQTQIAPSGAYIQHSTNYHRLALQVALWVDTLRRKQGQAWHKHTRQRLAEATNWLLALCDPAAGRVPNLGPNDGALVLPMAACPFNDYRPTLQAASLAFLGRAAFPAGPWDELALWLDLPDLPRPEAYSAPLTASDPLVLHAVEGDSWAYLRAARFTARPGHADQLHLDLWWRGVNLAQDAGTYLYNAAHPWENALAHSAVHNTLTVNGQEQMKRTGRFLYLDWAQAQEIKRKAEDGSIERISAAHDGYRKLGLLHRRSVETRPNRWLVEDTLEKLPGAGLARLYTVRLHWLLPDWEWELEQQDAQVQLTLHPPGILPERTGDMVRLVIRMPDATRTPTCALLRAGQVLHGTLPASSILGWVSPTYGIKLPALSLVVEAKGLVPITLTSEWILPD